MRHVGVIELPWSRLRTVLGIPNSVHLDGVSYDPRSNVLGLVVEGHTTLPQVPDGQIAPVVDVVYGPNVEGTICFQGFVPEPEPMLDTLEAP